MELRPQDLALVLKLAASRTYDRTTASLAAELFLSVGETHNAFKRAQQARLLFVRASDEPRRSGRPRRKLLLNRRGLEELVLHGVPYVFIAERGPVTRGVPTGHSAAPLAAEIVQSGTPIVWAYAKGAIRGESLSPLYPGAVNAALADPEFHGVLALVDAIRAGSTRERNLGAKLFQNYLKDLPFADA